MTAMDIWLAIIFTAGSLTAAFLLGFVARVAFMACALVWREVTRRGEP